MTTTTIEVDLNNTAVGPRVIYADGTDAADVDAEVPAGWTVDYSSQVRTSDGRWSCPLVANAPTAGDIRAIRDLARQDQSGDVDDSYARTGDALDTIQRWYSSAAQAGDGTLVEIVDRLGEGEAAKIYAAARQPQPDIKVIARAKFFSSSGVEERACLVEPDGTVRVWDEVAGHYTLCHALSADDQERIRRLANGAQS